jgi:hypothetical protein
VTNDVTLDYAAITTLYQRRWGVEMNQAQCTHTNIAFYPLAA